MSLMSTRTWTNAETGVVIATAANLDYPWETEDVLEGLEDDLEAYQADGSAQAYDPTQHTVEEVLEELDRVAEDEAEVARILEAEKAGKGRKGIVSRETE